jgi:hypothetical protein
MSLERQTEGNTDQKSERKEAIGSQNNRMHQVGGHHHYYYHYCLRNQAKAVKIKKGPFANRAFLGRKNKKTESWNFT